MAAACDPRDRCAGARRARDRLGKSRALADIRDARVDRRVHWFRIRPSRRRRTEGADVTRVVHIPTLPWQPTEAIARSCREVAGALDGVESLLLVDGEPGSWADPFTDYRVIDRWTPLTPWKTGFARALHELRPDVVHLHGGELAPALAFAAALRGLPVVAT